MRYYVAPNPVATPIPQNTLGGFIGQILLVLLLVVGLYYGYLIYKKGLKEATYELFYQAEKLFNEAKEGYKTFQSKQDSGDDTHKEEPKPNKKQSNSSLRDDGVDFK